MLSSTITRDSKKGGYWTSVWCISTKTVRNLFPSPKAQVSNPLVHRLNSTWRKSKPTPALWLLPWVTPAEKRVQLLLKRLVSEPRLRLEVNLNISTCYLCLFPPHQRAGIPCPNSQFQEPRNPLLTAIQSTWHQTPITPPASECIITYQCLGVAVGAEL